MVETKSGVKKSWEKKIKKVEKKNVEKKSGVKKSWEKKSKKFKKSEGEKSKQAVVEVASELLFGLVQNAPEIWN